MAQQAIELDETHVAVAVNAVRDDSKQQDHGGDSERERRKDRRMPSTGDVDAGGPLCHRGGRGRIPQGSNRSLREHSTQTTHRPSRALPLEGVVDLRPRWSTSHGRQPEYPYRALRGTSRPSLTIAGPRPAIEWVP